MQRGQLRPCTASPVGDNPVDTSFPQAAGDMHDYPRSVLGITVFAQEIILQQHSFYLNKAEAAIQLRNCTEKGPAITAAGLLWTASEILFLL